MAQHYVAGADAPAVLVDFEIEAALLQEARAENVGALVVSLILVLDRMVEAIQADFG